MKKPYRYLWLLLPVFLLYANMEPQRTVGIQLHDTYYVSVARQVWTFLSILFPVAVVSQGLFLGNVVFALIWRYR
ncbi:hypothetical protein [Lewinella sp. IMCC34191]|uniref:hypothetical protein n=1 Tax=Lewinella sp. IMCC34191 TaxID=2259172 RepID=UPI000E23C0AA|nr:hypothetical protein [Lewinella sp. IMCC34191]